MMMNQTTKFGGSGIRRDEEDDYTEEERELMA